VIERIGNHEELTPQERNQQFFELYNYLPNDLVEEIWEYDPHAPIAEKVSGVIFGQVRRSRGEQFNIFHNKVRELLQTAHITSSFREYVRELFGISSMVGIDKTDPNNRIQWLFNDFESGGIFNKHKAIVFERIGYFQLLDRHLELSSSSFEMEKQISEDDTRLLTSWRDEFVSKFHEEP
jgi:hypothetical protein